MLIRYSQLSNLVIVCFEFQNERFEFIDKVQTLFLGCAFSWSFETVGALSSAGMVAVGGGG